VTNEELLARTSAARGLAHRAPFAEWSKDHRGHSAIVNHTHAWAERGEDFLTLAAECDRRGLALPPCDCPAGAHDDVKGRSNPDE
jgi:hypothetical protein